MDKQELLRRLFGYTAFRPGQEELIDGLLAGRDVLGIMPTGGGKSLCYQIPALLLPGVTLVISPLISLMRDQVLALKAAGVGAAYINSSLTPPQLQAVYRNLLAGKYKIVYVAPERLEGEQFLAAVSQLTIPILAVDEAHCISQWGQDFRPSYLRILRFAEALPTRPAIGAFTATATQQVRQDIEKCLALQNPVRVVTGFDRPNLFFDVLRPKQKDEELYTLLASRLGKSGIIYCSTRRAVEKVCENLNIRGFCATRYHAGLEEAERRRNQEDFLYDRKPIMVATNAFGMGIDKSNVSFVIHYNMPKSIEAYYQEAGRAGRDGAEAECVLLFSAGDVSTARYLIENGSDNEDLTKEQREEVRRADLERLSCMVSYCRTDQCFRGYILDYFGEKHGRECGCCGNCKRTFRTVEVTREAQMILSCVRRVYDRLGYYVGAAMVVRILRGSKDRRIGELNLDDLTTYGLLRERSREDLNRIVDALKAQGYLEAEQSKQFLRLTPQAAEVLYRGKKVWMRVPIEKRQRLMKPAAQEDQDLFEILREVRGRIAKKANVPAYVVFSNATLQDMAKKKPRNTTQFKQVSGVGELKAIWYAKPFLEAIRDYEQED